MSALPTCSVVVPTKHRSDLLRRCLSSLVRLDPKPIEMLVVDNSFGDMAAKDAAIAAGARYICEPALGVSRAKNTGARLATGEIVAFVDDDVVVEPDLLGSLLRPFADPTVMAVTGRVMRLTNGGTDRDRLTTYGWLDLGGVPRTFDQSIPNWFELANFGGVGNGPTMAIRHQLFDSWVGFRESMGHGTPIPGGEENYAFFQLLAAGHRIVYAPTAIVAHPDPETPEAARYLRARVLRQAGAHIALLLLEEPRYRWRTLRFLARAIQKRGRQSREPDLWPADLSAMQRLAALARGPWLYGTARLHARLHIQCSLLPNELDEALSKPASS